MTPAARVQAAIECLDLVLAGTPAEKCLTRWSRQNRFAGSKDRAAIRDLVFTALRRRRSLAHIGGSDTGRGLLIGLVQQRGEDLDDIFTGARYAPATVTDDVIASGRPLGSAPWPVRLDVPDWLANEIKASLGDTTEAVLSAFQERAPVTLRTNTARTDRRSVIAALEVDGIKGVGHPSVGTAIIVVEGERRLRQSAVFAEGLVELQDASSQAAILGLEPSASPIRILDYCAGGGGKSLAAAARWSEATVYASDENPGRMRDLPARVRRARANVEIVEKAVLKDIGPFDLVMCDVPCSGSGTWRRHPDAKWKLAPDSLEALTQVQAEILRQAAGFVGQSGLLTYMTCSFLRRENEDQIAAFEVPKGWSGLKRLERLGGVDGGDGFFVASIAR